MGSGRLSCVLLLLLVVRWSGSGGEAAPAPLFGLGSALAGSLFGSIATSSNSTSLLEVLAAQHLQSKLDALTALSEALGLAGNVTASATVTG